MEKTACQHAWNLVVTRDGNACYSAANLILALNASGRTDASACAAPQAEHLSAWFAAELALNAQARFAACTPNWTIRAHDPVVAADASIRDDHLALVNGVRPDHGGYKTCLPTYC